LNRKSFFKEDVLTVIPILALFVQILFLRAAPESPRWLLARKTPSGDILLL
jgi:hypothetical protein